MLKKKFNKDLLKAFLQRRRINTLGLSVITAVSAVITLLSALNGFARTNILVLITVLLILLCLVQLLRNRRGFRTLHASRAMHRKRPTPKDH